MTLSSHPPDDLSLARSKGGAIARRAHLESHDVYVPDESPIDRALGDACAALYRELRFDEGLARARRAPGWEQDPEARLYAGIGMHYQRRYGDARAEYMAAMELGTDASFRATCVANAGTTWFEEGDLDRALGCYDRAVALDPLNEFGLLGRVAVACQRYDEAAVVDAARLLCERWPAWRERPVIASMLLKDRSFRFVREADGLFERAFGARAR